MELPSKLLEAAVEHLSGLPGIGKKTALRMALHLLKDDTAAVLAMAESLKALRTGIGYCENCCNISDNELCSLCSNRSRNSALICVVEDLRDVIAIESTRQYGGLYHVLNGLISPLDGMGPEQLTIDILKKRIVDLEQDVEVIFALSANMEGDTTAFFLHKVLSPYPVSFSSLSRGISVGGELQYADELTLARAISARTAYGR